MHSKRCGLIEKLLELGHAAEAREELVHARRAAFAAADTAAIKELDALANQLAATAKDSDGVFPGPAR
jgi:hypothetical protein